MSSQNQNRTNVPLAVLTDNGYKVPDEQSIKEGLLKDFLQVKGINNTNSNTPQGQIATTLAFAIGSVYQDFLDIVNGMNPDLTSGIMQDSICALFGIYRKQGTPTLVNATVKSSINTFIPQGTRIAQDVNNNYYINPFDENISQGLNDIKLQCEKNGNILCPAHSLELYSSSYGIISLDNNEDGIPGEDIEDSYQLEKRRKSSLYINAQGTDDAIMASLQQLDDVKSAFVVSNRMDTESPYYGVDILPHHIFISVFGGNEKEIGQVILNKAPAGVPLQGNTTINVEDISSVYSNVTSSPVYPITFNKAVESKLFINISIDQNMNMPPTFRDDIKKCILDAVNDGRIGLSIACNVYASKIIQVIMNQFTWCYDMTLTISNDNNPATNKITFSAREYPVVSSDTIKVDIQGIIN